MKGKTVNVARRHFLRHAVHGAGMMWVCGSLPRLATAADLPDLDATSAMAKALGYVADGSSCKNPAHKPKDACENCQFYSGTSDSRGSCQLFPGKSVAATGWCMSYVKKTS